MMKRECLKLVLSLVLGAGAAMPAFAADTPVTLAGVKVVKADEMKKMLDAGTPVFDVREAAEHAEKSIKGTKSVPYKEKSAKEVGFDASQDKFDLSKLPGDKAAPIVFFCSGIACWKSYKASVVAQKAGHSKVFWFRGGMPEWVAAGQLAQ